MQAPQRGDLRLQYRGVGSERREPSFDLQATTSTIQVAFERPAMTLSFVRWQVSVSEPVAVYRRPRGCA